MFKVSLVVIVMSYGYDNGTRYAPSIDVTRMDNMEHCESVKRHLVEVFETEYPKWKTSVDCVTN